MEQLPEWLSFVPEKVTKNRWFRAGVSFLLVLLAALFEYMFRGFIPGYSIFFYLPPIILSLYYVHPWWTLGFSTLFLQFFVLSRANFEVNFPRDTYTLVTFDLVYLMLFVIFRHAKAEAVELRKKLTFEVSSRFLYTSSLTSIINSHLQLFKIGSTYLDNHEAGTEKYKKAVKLMVQKSEEMDHLIRDVQNVSVLAIGRPLELVLTDLPLRSIVTEVVTHYQFLHPGKIELESVSDGVVAKWNGEGMKRVLHVLLSNALRFGNEKPITVTFTESSDSADLKVVNQGVILSEREILSLFTPFKKMMEGKVTAESGAGLNLTMVKGIVEAHDGNIKVLSNKIEGTIFQVLLPLRK